MLAADVDERLGLATCETGLSITPCRVAVDGLAEGWSSEGEVVGPGASVGNGVENGKEKGASSKVPPNMDEME